MTQTKSSYRATSRCTLGLTLFSVNEQMILGPMATIGRSCCFEAVNGFNEQDLAVAFNDVDLCLKVLQLGKRNLYCAQAELYHHESISRGSENTPEKRHRFERELAYLQNTWQAYIASDPAYNPNLTLSQENFGLKQT